MNHAYRARHHRGQLARLVRGAVGIAALATCTTSEAPPAPPEIAISQSALQFEAIQLGANPQGKSVQLSNAGEGVLRWTAAASVGWLSVTPQSGEGPATLAIGVDVAGLEPGTVTGAITVTADGATNSPRTIQATLNVHPAPTIGLSKSEVAFAGVLGRPSPAAQTVDIHNEGGGTLTWSVSATPDWLSVTPTSGTGTGTIAVAVDVGQHQQAGSFEGLVTVSAQNATNTPRTIAVPLTITAPPVIGLSPSSVSLVVTPGDSALRFVTLRNTGGGALAWSVTNRADWLRVAPASGTLTDSAARVLGLQVNTMNLPEGVFFDTLVVTAPDATNDPQRLPVRLEVGAPRISVQSLLIVELATGDTTTRKLVLSNTGTGVLRWNATSRAAWLQVSPDSGNTLFRDTLSFRIDAAGLLPGGFGVYEDTVVITAPGASNSPQLVRVILAVSAPIPPSITLAPLSLTFAAAEGGANPPSQSVELSSPTSLAWTASATESWLAVSPTQGVGPATLAVSASTAGLTAFSCASNSFFGFVEVIPEDTTVFQRSVFVTLQLAAPPCISITPTATSLVFVAVEGKGNPPALTMGVNSTASENFRWVASKSSSWLIVTPDTGMTPTTVTVSVDAAGLTPQSSTESRTYRDTIRVASTAAANSPQLVQAFLVVEPPAKLAVADTLIPFVGTAGAANPPNKSLLVGNEGGDTLHFAITKQSDWLAASPSSGSIFPRSERTITLAAALGGLAVGTYHDTLTITAPDAANAPQRVPLRLTVAPVYDGTWVGKTGIDSTITFQISGNRITSMSMGLGGIASSCGGTVSGAISGNPNVDIASGAFTITLSGSPFTATVSGTFGSTTSVSGDVTMRFSVTTPGPPFSCSGARTTTWSATRQ